jgi:pimeloyl-ACP methyl ester carboxylesterase
MSPVDQKPAVILVHGLWFGSWAMARLARELQRADFKVFRFSYSSTRAGIEANARQLEAFVQAHAVGETHFVGHSLGGLLILRMLSAADDVPPGRVVLLGSPLRGSAVARKSTRVPGGSKLLGLAREDLFTGYARLPEAREIGMIAGSRAVGLGRLVGGTDGPGDGTVAVDETRAPGLAAHRTLPVSHTSMLFSAQVAQMTVNFLQSGRFEGRGA